jgi:hypothetical protein
VGKRQENNIKLANEFFVYMGEKFPKLELIGEYKTRRGKLEVKCKECNYEWTTTPDVLMKIKDCICCSGQVYNKDTYQKLLDESNKTLDLISDYNGSQKPIDVRCRFCGYEWTTCSANHLKTSGCPSCSKKLKGTVEKLQQCFEDFRHKVRVLGKYVNNFTPIECLCLVCNETFFPSGATIIYGSGCSNCRKGGFNSRLPGYLYYLRVIDGVDVYWKIGITNIGVKARFKGSDRRKISVLYCHLFENGKDACVAESNILKMFKDYQAINVDILSVSNTELFTKDVLQMNHLNWGPI